MANIKNEIDRINSLFLINSPYFKDPSLGQGLFGIGLYLYYYSTWKNDKQFKEIAKEVLNSACRLPKNITCDYFNGLAGIGFSVDKLHRDGFLTSEPNLILSEVDSRIFYEIATVDYLKINTLWSLGKYLRSRFSNSNTPSIYHEFLNHLTDKIFRYYQSELKKGYLFNLVDVRCINLIKWGIKNRINLVKMERLYDFISNFVEEQKIENSNAIIRMAIYWMLGKQFYNLEGSNFRLSKNSIDLRAELILLLYLSKDDTSMQLKKFVLATLNDFILNANELKTNIVGLSKLDLNNYGINGFSGWGILLLSSESEFDKLDWVEIFI